jgi:hypothetical protein
MLDVAWCGICLRRRGLGRGPVQLEAGGRWLLGALLIPLPDTLGIRSQAAPELTGCLATESWWRCDRRGMTVDLARCGQPVAAWEAGMAQKITVGLKGDLDGPADVTIRLRIGGTEYELDLSKKRHRVWPQARAVHRACPQGWPRTALLASHLTSVTLRG